MKQKHEFKSIVAETLLIPLYMRAKESRRERPILNDKAAECLADSLEYDYSRSTELVKAWFASMQRKYPEINTTVSDFIIHLHTVWMFTMFEELLMHSVPKQEMEAILHDYILFEIQGWRAIIKI